MCNSHQKAVLKSTNNRATGKKMVEVPNSAIVPTTIDMNTIKKNISNRKYFP